MEATLTLLVIAQHDSLKNHENYERTSISWGCLFSPLLLTPLTYNFYSLPATTKFLKSNYFVVFPTFRSSIDR